ncbi:2-deoxyglucose-6-phosphate phosphatase [Marinomonas spartinae]|uniref:hexitol phosphatase HxpB n=1 Tax=Marinomonas spartinae TaxID=1792290 RepID=UPI000808B4E6|nr:hexitol phosphatase HxpB [Marinomonas spartinae]SBS28936.1 2-deoxyglucose-6-phosphate phosphatase [Marinomonas spartinae]
MQAVIFDMDGLLIDSEPMWKEAEQTVFSAVGVKVNESLSAQTASMTTQEVTQFWYQHFPWTGKSLQQVEQEVVDLVEKRISTQGIEMAGVTETLRFFQDKGFKIGLSTNAPARLIPVVLHTLGIADYFHATSSSEQEVEGKPHPAVYLSTVKKLNVDPANCIAFEDSASGIMAAKAAGLKVVAVPAEMDFDHPKYDNSHLKIRSLTDFNECHLEKLLKP